MNTLRSLIGLCLVFVVFLNNTAFFEPLIRMGYKDKLFFLKDWKWAGWSLWRAEDKIEDRRSIKLLTCKVFNYSRGDQLYQRCEEESKSPCSHSDSI